MDECKSCIELRECLILSKGRILELEDELIKLKSPSWKCWWGFHRWGKWYLEKFKKTVMVAGVYSEPIQITLQMRECNSCGLEETREF